MDAFEQIVGQLLEEDKYWVRYSVKIDLSKDEKKLIGKPTAPRPEIDLVAFDIRANKIFLLEVKSFLDSTGVKYQDVTQIQTEQAGRYKLLTSENYRRVLAERLRTDWLQSGHINRQTQIGFGLIAGNVYMHQDESLEKYFTDKGWLFWGPQKIKEKVRQLSDKGYENNAVTIAAKLLMRT